MENSAQPEKSEARKRLETCALLGIIAKSMDEAQAAEAADEEAMRDLDVDAESEREKDRATEARQDASPGFRRKMFPVQKRWVFNRHYRKDHRTGCESWLAGSLGQEIVKEISIEVAETRKPGFVEPVCVMVNRQEDAVVRKHVTVAKPWDGRDRRTVQGGGKEKEHTSRCSGGLDLRAVR